MEVPQNGFSSNLSEQKLAEIEGQVRQAATDHLNSKDASTALSHYTDDVVAASRRAIDDAGAGGGFVLSTGDQCGRDTPDENLRAMVETARTYGRY